MDYALSNIKPYVCKECDKRFAKYTLLRVHTQVHKDEVPSACATKDNVPSISAIRNEASSTCEIKNEMLSTCAIKEEPNDDNQVHAGVEIVSSGNDNESLFNSIVLNAHTEPSEERFKCEVCEKSFNGSYKLKRHLSSYWRETI